MGYSELAIFRRPQPENRGYNYCMPTALGKLLEIRQEAGGLSGTLACPPGMHPAPGQYLLASSLSPHETAPTPLFPASLPGGDLRVAPPLPLHWMVGQALHLRGPLGRGFDLPSQARRVALYAEATSPGSMLPIATQALERGAAVALYTRSVASTPAQLPADIEILPPDLLPEALDWADYLAVSLPLGRLAAFRRALGIHPRQPTRCRIQALLVAPMPCGGLSECGVCAVLTRSGWRHACKDGPVFDLDELEDG